jgi:hypothetical protein
VSQQVGPRKLQDGQAKGNYNFENQPHLQHSGGGQKSHAMSRDHRERCQDKNSQVNTKDQLLFKDAKLGLEEVTRQENHNRTHQNQDRQPVQTGRGFPQELSRNAGSLGLGVTWRLLADWANHLHTGYSATSSISNATLKSMRRHFNDVFGSYIFNYLQASISNFRLQSVAPPFF